MAVVVGLSCSLVTSAGRNSFFLLHICEPHLFLSAQGSDGTLRGSTGCNAISGTFARDGGGLRFGPLATTMRACAPEISLQEQSFLRALDETASQRIVGDALDLLDASGAVVMRLEARRMQ